MDYQSKMKILVVSEYFYPYGGAELSLWKLCGALTRKGHRLYIITARRDGEPDYEEKEGIDVRIINMSTIKPLDDEAVIKAAEETGAVVTAENGTIIGSLGEAVAGVLAENMPTPMVMVGVDDEFSQSGRISKEADDLKAHFKLGAEDLAAAVKRCIEKKK